MSVYRRGCFMVAVSWIMVRELIALFKRPFWFVHFDARLPSLWSLGNEKQKFVVGSWTVWSIVSVHLGWDLESRNSSEVSLAQSPFFYIYIFSFIFPTSLLEISTAGWLFVPTHMSCSPRVMLFPKIRHTSALCYGLLEVNVFWMDLQQTVYSGRVRGEILFGFALTYQKQVWNPRHSWLALHSECRRITTHLRSKAEPNGSFKSGHLRSINRPPEIWYY